jgi:hypothetical protein
VSAAPILDNNQFQGAIAQLSLINMAGSLSKLPSVKGCCDLAGELGRRQKVSGDPA